ncbi:MAG: hypothetical protein COB30_005420 [Ectothiorhodospiraceae bacterium]|nr:hypothetical protein [Ectothiorhodospiraceae bacterium]
MNILGISFGGESGAALFVNNELKYAVNEERLSRIKLDCSYPRLSIDWCLNEAGIEPKNIDLVCFGFSGAEFDGTLFSSINDRMQEYNADEKEIILSRIIIETAIDSGHKKEFELEILKKFKGVSTYFCNHHDSHKYSTYVTSEYESALIITADGRGDYKSLTISLAKSNKIKELYYSHSWESLGYFYGRITHLCGFKPNRHEGKITGLAAYGDPLKALPLMKKMIGLEDGMIRSYPGMRYTPFFSNYSDLLKLEISTFCREDIAAAAQRHIENILQEIIKKYIIKTSVSNICLAGGVFGNVKLNQSIYNMDEVESIFVYPNMGDGGVCAGSVYKYYYEKDNNKKKRIPTLYLGPSINVDKIKARLENDNFSVTKPDDIFKTVSDLLINNKIIGLVQGRCEFGPRSLGNRSIIASCDNKSINSVLNERLGRTEFMPFAPAISCDLAHRSLMDYKPLESSKHMTLTYNVTKDFVKNCPAVVHVDNTARPQIVTESDNNFFYHLLNVWFERSGKLALINTSFNFHEEPIVSGDDDVIKTFKKGAVDYLLFPPYLVEYTQI